MYISDLSVEAKADLDFIYENGRDLALQNERPWNQDDRFSILTGSVSAVYFPVTERLQTHIIDDPREIVYRGQELTAAVDRYVIVRPQQDRLSLGEQMKHSGRRRSVALPLRTSQADKIATFLQQYREDFLMGQSVTRPSRGVLYQPWG